MNTLQKLFGLMILGLIVGGCASPWEANFDPNSDAVSAKFPASSSVEVRTIPFERYERYVQAERQRRITSTTAPQDLSEQERLAEKGRLLETLQLKDRADEIDVLGWSEFTYDEPLKPNDPKLVDFAKKIGADYVVIASTYTGQVTRTEDRAITTYSQGFTTFRRGRGAGRRGAFPSSYSDQTTTWVPVQVTRDQYFYEAVYLRKRRA
jgi:hypothetical protein